MTDDFRDLIARLEEQERRLTFDRFDNANAWALGCLLVDLATDRDLPIAVDIRRGSPTYGRHVSATLSAENWAQLWVPAGFAHAYCTLEPDTEVIYKVTAYHDPEAERGVAWDDPEIAADWGVTDPVLSDRDQSNPKRSNLPTARQPHLELRT